MKLFKKLLKNHNVIYILNKYGIFVLGFINSIFIAVKLGPYYLGIWGFITLVISYLEKVNFGIPNSLNILASKNKGKENYVEEVTNNSLGLMSLVILLLLLFFIGLRLLDFEIGAKYHFNQYLPYVLIAGCFTFLNSIFSNILRIYSRVNVISLAQSIRPVLTILAIPFLMKENLLWALVLIIMISTLLSTALYYWRMPFKIKFSLDKTIVKTIFIKGFFLFVYGTSFYLIMLSAKSFISSNYKVEEFGYFTFSFSFANAALLLMSSMSFLVWPKIIHSFTHSTKEKTREVLNRIRGVYISVSHILIHFANMVFPVFLLFFPQYGEAQQSFVMIGLTLILYNSSFGYQGLLMAKDREKLLSIISLSALILNVVLCYVFVALFNVSFSFVIGGTLITYFIYVLVISYFGLKELEVRPNILQVFKEVYPSRVLIPFLMALYFVLSGLSNLYYVIPFTLYIFLNINDLKLISTTVKQTFKNPNLLSI